MKNLNYFWACGSINLGPGFTVLISCLAAFWLVAIVLGLVNILLISSLKNRVSHAGANALFFMAYVALALGLFTGVFNESSFIVVPIFVVPIMSVSQFVFLLSVRRKLRKQAARAEDETIKPGGPDNLV